MSAVAEDTTLTRRLWHIAGSGDLEELDQLLSQGVDVNACDRTGVTALMRAAYHGQLGMVRALIGYGADPIAKDRSGLTALMMAKHGGHDEIVEALGRFGPQSTEVAKKPRLVASVTEQNIDAETEHEDWASGNNSESPRALHEPLEIWEMVHTTQPASYTLSADSRRVFSTKTLALAVGALIICSGVVFGFLALRGAMSATDDTAPQQPEASEQRLSTSKSLTRAPGKTRSSNELTNLKPIGNLVEEHADPPVVASSVLSAKKSAASQRPKATKVNATVPKQNKSVRRATKLEGEQDASAKSAKKESAPASDPVKPSTTQKPKVIQWP